MPVDMSFDMTLEVWSLAASVASVVLGLVAIALSLTFYVQGNRANTAASQALAKVETLVGTIQTHAFGMLEQTIQRISSSALLVTHETVPADAAQQASRNGENDDRRSSAMNAEAKALSELYGAEMQLGNPMYTAVFGLIGGAPMVQTELRRVRDLIAVKRALLEKEYGVKFDGPPQKQALSQSRDEK